jgi:hypothetical protein
MTPNEITTLIATNLKKELDIRFRKQLYERVKYWRSTLIKQSLDKVQQDAKFFVQTIFMTMEKVNIHECSEDLRCFNARTVDEIPTPLRITDGGIFHYFGSIDGQSPFGYAQAGTLRYLTAGKYSKLRPHYEYTNRRGYVAALPDLPKIRISAIFNNPEEAMPYLSCDGEADYTCDWWNIDIPMSNDITQRVVQSILVVDYNRPVTPTDPQTEVNATTPTTGR